MFRELRFSVSRTLEAAFLVLAAALAVTILILIMSAVRARQDAHRVLLIAEGDRIAFETTTFVRVTRARVLAAHFGLDDDERLKEIHREFDATLGAALARLNPAALPNGDDHMRAIRKTWADVEPAWTEVEALSGRPREERDQVVKRWFDAVTGIVDRLMAFSRDVVGELRVADPIIAELVSARQFAWELREASGNECLLMRPALVGGDGISADLRSSLDRLRGRGEATWSALDELVARPRAPPDLVRAVGGAQEAYRRANAERDGAYRRLAIDGNARLPAAEWNRLCLAPFGIILQIAATALDLIGAHATARDQAARRQLVAAAAGLIAAVMAGVLAQWIVRHRVTAPVRTLTAAIGHLSRPNYSIPVPQLARRDEFGNMAATLEALRLAALDAERAAAERKHSQKLEALGTLAGGIAHDLNNTLVPVLALTKLVVRRLPAGSRERSNIETVLRASERARDLVKQMLAFSRKEPMEKRASDVAEVAREALMMLRASIPGTIRIVEEIAEVPMVLADAGQLHQVIVNLVTNAAQAMDGGTGCITVGVQTIPWTAPDDASEERGRSASVCLYVEDTGKGMDEATLGRIFDPFFTTKPVGEGTGLGLSIVHGIIADHNGRIAVRSRPGIGTRFDIYLPVLDVSPRPEQGRPGPDLQL